MWGVVSIWLSACLFVHLGLGRAIGRVLRVRLILFRCSKCLSFWSVLAYSLLFTNLPAEGCLLVSFVLAYAALWLDLLLAVIAELYEKLYKDLEATGEPDD